MSKRLILILVVVYFFSYFNLAWADVVINEVMYDLDGGDIDYLEVLNNGSFNVDLTGYKFVINNDSVNGHEISINSGSQNLKPGDYGVIVANSVISNYINKWGSTGNIFTASFSLPNSITTTIILKNQSLIQIDKAEYNPLQSGASSDGNSLQLISGSWVAATPTPGTSNQTLVPEVTPIPNLTLVSEPTVIPEAKTKIVEVPKIKTKIITKTFSFVGIPLSFQAIATGLSGEQLNYGKYFWNFGDGDSKEIKSGDSQLFNHTYFYPGEYVVSLDYYQNYYSNTPDASDKITIKVVGTDIVISRVGDEKDFFVELANNTIYDADISNWVLKSDNKSFTIPRNTIIPPKKVIIISPKITNFSFEDKNTLKLMTPQGDIVFNYFSPVIPVISEVAVLPKNKVPKVAPSSSVEFTPPTTVLINPNENIQTKDLVASAYDSNVLSPNLNTKSLYSSLVIPISSFVFIGVSAYAVYIIRRKRIPSVQGDDFEILDE